MSERDERAAFVSDLTHKVEVLEAKLQKLSQSVSPAPPKPHQQAQAPASDVQIDVVLLQLGQRITNPFIFTVSLSGRDVPGSVPCRG
jgi:hypothetical protein